MSTLAVAMLVKEPPVDRLALLLEYLRTLVTEVVIVDTGSSGKTLGIMSAWAGRFDKFHLIPEKFINFSQARNAGVEAVTSDWTLIVDPDELPSAPMMAHIKAVLDYDANRPNALGWCYWTVNYWGGLKGPEEQYHWHCRLFKTGHGRFYRPVHELVSLDGQPERTSRGTPVLPYAPADAVLIHSKHEATIEEADALYAQLGETSR